MLSWGAFIIYWYGFLYIIGFITGWLLLPRLLAYRHIKITHEQRVWLVILVMFGVLAGGRLGHVFLYEPHYFWQHPTEIFALWQGGMSSHGGFVGVGLALWWVAKRWKIPLLALIDVLVVPLAVGLALGRLGNFINQELYGVVTQVPWAISIPGVEGERHPTQLYAVAKDLLIAFICYWQLRKSRNRGTVTALFLLLYGVGRFFLEYLRVNNYPLIMIGDLAVTRGQFFTVPLILFGFFVYLYTHQSNSHQS